MTATNQMAQKTRDGAKNRTTESLMLFRKLAQGNMRKLQDKGHWTAASNYHEAFIGPVNDELLTRGVW